MSRDHSIRPAAAFFGRRKGKTLRAFQASNLHQVFPQYRLDIENPPPADLRELFDVEITAIRMEIGFGGGEHLLHEADRCPETGFIGIEPFVNGMAKCVSALATAPLPNVRLFDDDAIRLLDWLAPASVDQVDLLYPDPWPKKRHWKRRFVSPPNLDRLVRVLRTGGKFCFASDIDTYVNWTLLHCRDHPGLAWQARTAADWRDPYDNWSGTRYEAKALREGRTAAYLTFQRR